jgi:hypothetical protein
MQGRENTAAHIIFTGMPQGRCNKRLRRQLSHSKQALYILSEIGVRLALNRQHIASFQRPLVQERIRLPYTLDAGLVSMRN